MAGTTDLSSVFCIIIREKIQQETLWNFVNFLREMSLLRWKA